MHEMSAGVPQDTDKLVRQCMCEQLPALALSLGREPCAAVILPEILELAEDEERAVRCAAIRALGSILHLLPPDLRRARTFPFLRALCTAADISAEVQRCVARLFCGQLIQVRSFLCCMALGPKMICTMRTLGGARRDNAIHASNWKCRIFKLLTRVSNVHSELNSRSSPVKCPEVAFWLRADTGGSGSYS